MLAYELHLDSSRRIYFKSGSRYYNLPANSCLASTRRSFLNDCINLQKGTMVLGDPIDSVIQPTTILAKFDIGMEIFDNKLFMTFGY